MAAPMSERGGFEADWLAARAPYDEAALDRSAVDAISAWGAQLPADDGPVVVDLGSGTGVAIERARRWLAPRRIVAYAVDQDADLLAQAQPADDGSRVVRVRGDLLAPLDAHGGPPDGTVDLVVGHALADLVPLDRLAARVAALLRPGGLAHLALAYDGLTAFEPAAEPDLDAAIVDAFHRHMDRPARTIADYGGSTAGRRLGAALTAAGLDVLVDGRSRWHVRAADGPGGRRVLERLIRYVVEAAQEIGGLAPGDLARWQAERMTALAHGTLAVKVGHRDVLARRPLER
jgi:SAM-dependent methyltransferase